MKEIEIKDFDYSLLEQDKKETLIENEKKIEKILSASAYDLGGILIETKEMLGHGKFLEWLKCRWNWSERTAENMINIHKSFKSAKFADLFPKSIQYSLSAPSVPESAREEALETEGKLTIKQTKDNKQNGKERT